MTDRCLFISGVQAAGSGREGGGGEMVGVEGGKEERESSLIKD